MFGSSRTIAARMALVIGGLAALAIIPIAALERLPESCLFQRFFDHACLGCGMTRSLSAWLHGDVAGAQAFHPAGPWVAMLAFALVMLDTTLLLRNGYRAHATARAATPPRHATRTGVQPRQHARAAARTSTP